MDTSTIEESGTRLEVRYDYIKSRFWHNIIIATPLVSIPLKTYKLVQLTTVKLCCH